MIDNPAAIHRRIAAVVQEGTVGDAQPGADDGATSVVDEHAVGNGCGRNTKDSPTSPVGIRGAVVGKDAVRHGERVYCVVPDRAPAKAYGRFVPISDCQV